MNETGRADRVRRGTEMEQAWLRSATLEGAKVRLRPMGPGDIQDCFERIHDNPRITDWLCWDGPEAIEELSPWYLTWPLGDAQRGWDYHFAVIDLEDKAFAGVISLRYYDHAFQGDIGYWIDVNKWGRGLATEAVSLLTWLAFEHTGAILVYAEWFEGNLGSQRVLERAGFQPDPTGDHRFQKGDRDILVHFHSLTRSAWEEAGKPGKPRVVRILAGERADSHEPS